MLDFFTIFSKGGIVLWYFQGTVGSFTTPVNDLIQSVILQERSSLNTFTHGQLSLKYKLDNEFELVFVVAYQKILQLAYIDKLLTQIQLEFRDKYKDDLKDGQYGTFSFDDEFNNILRAIENESRNEKRVMSKFVDSKKAKKIMEKKGVLEVKENRKTKEKEKDTNLFINGDSGGKENYSTKEAEPALTNGVGQDTVGLNGTASNGDDKMMKQRELLMKGMLKGGKKKPTGGTGKTQPSPIMKKDRKKEARQWQNSGTSKDMASLDYSKGSIDLNGDTEKADEFKPLGRVGSMVGDLKGIDIPEDEEEESLDEDEENVESEPNGVAGNNTAGEGGQKLNGTKEKGLGSGLFSFFKGLAGQKAITKETMEPVLDKMREHLCAKNVAADISEKLCQSVANKLDGKVLGTFSGITSAVKSSMEESLVNILSPKKKIDILRDVLEAKQKGRPYTIVFCGVNGVGKSTNLAKICFWLMENDHRVLIAACDTFRSGAVEQLRTHQRHLSSLHPPASEKAPPKVLLYDKGYGKDAAAVAMEAINFAREQRIDVVLVDTAGRMQDNEPLMRSLAKLIKINDPSLVLFVGEALVGNDGVDQLSKFNQALADHSDAANPRLIDGIVLTKFDTIDDKVGAAISMTYTTGQPIVFVGTGQTYADLRNLNVNAVVKALLKS